MANQLYAFLPEIVFFRCSIFHIKMQFYEQNGNSCFVLVWFCNGKNKFNNTNQ